MKKLFLFIVLCIFLVSCSTDVKYYESGEIRSVLTKSLFSGNKLTYFYENGKKSAEGYVDESGCPIGKWTGYRAENDLFWECEYVENICLDTVIRPVEEQDERCHNYKWMKQYYQGVVSMDILQVDSLWNVRMFYKDYARGKMYARGDRDKLDKQTGRWNYYYADGKLAYSFVYEHGEGPVMPCERIPIKMSVDARKTEENGVLVYYFRFFLYDIDPAMCSIKVFPWNEHDTICAKIFNEKTEGENSADVYPYRIESPKFFSYNFGGTDNYILVGCYFQNDECNVNPNNKLFFISTKDLKQKDVAYFLDEKTGQFYSKK